MLLVAGSSTHACSRSKQLEPSNAKDIRRLTPLYNPRNRKLRALNPFAAGLPRRPGAPSARNVCKSRGKNAHYRTLTKPYEAPKL